jgi:hypothetical protein
MDNEHHHEEINVETWFRNIFAGAGAVLFGWGWTTRNNGLLEIKTPITTIVLWGLSLILFGIAIGLLWHQQSSYLKSDLRSKENDLALEKSKAESLSEENSRLSNIVSSVFSSSTDIEAIDTSPALKAYGRHAYTGDETKSSIKASK